MDGMEPKEPKEETWQDRVARLSKEHKAGNTSEAKELKRQDMIAKMTLSLIGLVIIGGLLALLSTCSDSPEKEAKRQLKAADRADRLCNDTQMAFFMSQDFVKQNLKSPTSAKFSSNPVATKNIGYCRTLVIATVDSQNSFGAMIRSSYSVEITYHKKSDNWSASGLVIE